MLQKRLDFEIYADYHQFYLEDEDSLRPFADGNVWRPEESDQMLMVRPGSISVGTARYETVPVSIEFHDAAPALDAAGYSRVNECSLRVASDNLVLSGCTEYLPEAARIGVRPGIYRVRVLYGNLETVVDDWEGEDFYLLQLWPEADERKTQLLKE